MKTNKLFLGLFALLTLAFTGCKDGGDDSYDWATVSGNQVYFSNELAGTQSVSVSTSSINIPIRRNLTTEAITVPLTVTKGAGSKYTIPTSVSFNEGQAEAMIPVSYDPNNVVYGEYEDVTIAIGDENYTTPYGLSTYSFQIGATAWVDYGTALYREDMVTHWFSVENHIYEVPIQKNVVEEGYYRLVNPYGKFYKYNEPGDYDEKTDSYLTINATDPDHVYVELSPTTMNWGYGTFSMQSYISYYLDGGSYTVEDLIQLRPNWFGTLKDGVITMPAGTMLISMSDYQEGGWYVANDNGLFAIALPGAVIADYSVEFAFVGRFTDADDVDYAEILITLGEDVAEAKYAWVTDDTEEEIYNDIVNGGSYPTISESGNVRIPYGETGTYTLMVVLYNAKGEVVGVEYYDVDLKSSKDGAPAWTDLYTGVMTYNEFWNDANPDEAVLSRSEEDPDMYRILPYFMNTKDGLVFHWDRENNVITFDEVQTGFADPNYGMVYVCDAPTYNSESFPFADYPSYYDSEEGVFHFATYQYVDAGSWGYKGEETFELTGEAAKAMMKAPAKKGNNAKAKAKFNKLPFSKDMSLKRVKKVAAL